MSQNLIEKTLELLELGLREPFMYDHNKLFVDEEGDIYVVTGTHDDGSWATVLSDYTLQDLLNNPEDITKIPAEGSAKDFDDNILLRVLRDGDEGCNVTINGTTNEVIQSIVHIIESCAEANVRNHPDLRQTGVMADIMTKITIGLLALKP